MQTIYTFKMTEPARLLGTSLRLHEGQQVLAQAASNLPQGGWFLYPADEALEPIWCDDSIHIDSDDSCLPPFESWEVLHA